MIPIYHSNKIDAYDEFLVYFWDNYLCLDKSGMVKVRWEKRKRRTFTAIAKKIKGIFGTFEEFKQFAYTPASQLGEVAKLVENYLPDMYDAKDEVIVKSKTYKSVYKLFVNCGYNSNAKEWKRYVRADVQIDTCPYCNRNFIRMSEANENLQNMQLDHFYPKDKYPFLAICLYNLVPCCSVCNGSGKKGNIDPNTMVNPFALKDSNGILFKVHMGNKPMGDLRRCASVMDISISSPNGQMSENIKVFKLQQMYDTHKDYAAEIYYKHRMKLNAVYYQKVIQRNCSRHLGLSYKDWQRIVLGVYTEPKDFGKRPLSKFCTDISKQFGLI